MKTLHRSPMLMLLEDLATCPDWESASWTEAVAIAIREAIIELQGTDTELVAQLARVEAVLTSAERARALEAALNLGGIHRRKLASRPVSARIIDWPDREAQRAAVRRR